MTSDIESLQEFAGDGAVMALTNALTVIGVGAAANGSAVNNGDGTITYTPAADFNGTDSYTATAIKFRERLYYILCIMFVFRAILKYLYRIFVFNKIACFKDICTERLCFFA